MNTIGMYAMTLSFIFIGTICYTFASYYHLKYNKDWNFWTALMIAIPFVLIEYTFSLHGNYYAYTHLKLDPSKILILTICFNFICIWLFNYFIMKIPFDHRNMMREILALILIMSAFYISVVVR
jgi:hypothetical protein